MANKIEPTAHPQPTSIHDLRPKMQLIGKVTKIDLYGAFVDIGIGQDALVHISKIKQGAVNRVDEVLSVGEEVTVFVDRVDADAARVSLTMIKPLAVNWRDLSKGQVFAGQVTRVEPYGIFVDIGAERAGMVHISELGVDQIGHPSELFSIGDQVEVQVTDYDRKKRRIDLTTVKADAGQRTTEAEETEESVPTAMELALRQAFEESDTSFPVRSQKRDRRGRGRRRQVQDDLLSRTLHGRKS